VTKLDLMDRGTDAMNILLGKVVPLHHGFCGVVNRSQQDIDRKLSIQEALRGERHWFQSHSVYKSIASRLGTPYLAKKLNSILMSHIRSCLPGVFFFAFI
jgi:replication fork clamp-binding protein CrfC